MQENKEFNVDLLLAEEPDIEHYERLRERVSGVLLGAAVADALGWPTEFTKSQSHAQRLFGTLPVSDFKPWEKQTGGRFNTYIDYISPGEYSDDTQLALCTARSILPDGSFDPDRFAQELPYWLDYARGAGATITKAARAIGRRNAAWNNNFFSSYQEAGANGGAMRIAPHILANKDDESQAFRGIWQNVATTHGHPRAFWGAFLYGKVLHLLMNQKDLDFERFLTLLREFVEGLRLERYDGVMTSWLEKWARLANKQFFDVFDETRHEVLDSLTLLKDARNKPLRSLYTALGCLRPSTRGSGTGTVLAAITTFLRHGGNYEKAVLESVNMFGSDTDTIAAMVGGMIGALKGQSVIPDRWINVMQDYGYFVRTAEALTRISLREAKGNDLVVDNTREIEERKDRDIVQLAQNRLVQRGQRVTHPILGLGWVSHVSSQQIRRRGGGTMLLARVPFDTGQTCVFRSYRPQRPEEFPRSARSTLNKTPWPKA